MALDNSSQLIGITFNLTRLENHNSQRFRRRQPLPLRYLAFCSSSKELY